MMKRLIKKSNIGLGLLSFVILSGCASNTPNTISSKVESAPYKRIIQFASDQGDLQAELEKGALKNRNYIVRSPEDFAEFRVILNSHVKRINTLETKPRLMGRLQRTKTPVNFTASYKITNTSRHTLAEGEITELTETQSAIYPKLGLSKNVEEEALKDVSAKILNEVNNYVTATKWSTTVVGQKDEKHITVLSGESAGLKIGDKLITETKPNGTLTVVMFEKTIKGQSRAILALTDGFLPNVGRKLIAAPKR